MQANDVKQFLITAHRSISGARDLMVVALEITMLCVIALVISARAIPAAWMRPSIVIGSLLGSDVAAGHAEADLRLYTSGAFRSTRASLHPAQWHRGCLISYGMT